MTAREFHLKWCHLFDETAVRSHKALLEAGFDCALKDSFFPSLGCTHRNITFRYGDLRDPLVLRATLLSMPPEMRDDWLTEKGIEDAA